MVSIKVNDGNWFTTALGLQQLASVLLPMKCNAIKVSNQGVYIDLGRKTISMHDKKMAKVKGPWLRMTRQKENHYLQAMTPNVHVILFI